MHSSVKLSSFGLLCDLTPIHRLLVISVRNARGLLAASFRHHFTMDLIAVRLYSSTIGRIRTSPFRNECHRAHIKRTLAYQIIASVLRRKARYSTILIRVPSSVLDSISKCPLCLSTIHLDMERPSPVPCLVLALSAR